MKYLKTIFVLCLVFGCQKPNKKHIAIGTWNICHKDGRYSEYKITDKYVINLTSEDDEVWLFKSKIADSTLLISTFNIGSGSTERNAMFDTISYTQSKIVLKSFGGERLELNRAEFDYAPIDSTNLKVWKNKTLAEFKKRVELAGCLDLRTEEEKVKPTLDLDDSVEEEIPIIEIEKK